MIEQCIPLERQRANKVNGTGNLSYSNARTMCRRRCIKIHGPPTDKTLVVRHLCENDSTMPNGFICVHPDHIKWDTQSNNMLDTYSEIGRRNIERQRQILKEVCSQGGKANLGKKKGKYKKWSEENKTKHSESIRLWWANRKKKD